MTSVITKKTDKKCQSLNNRLIDKILELNDDQILSKSHYFAGRYENIYVDINAISELNIIIDTARRFAAEILQRDVATLKIGFWINIMHQGHTTSLHSHEDADELLSGVFYVKVPEHSGRFIYHLDGETHSVQPEQGTFLFFSPSLLHEVEEHQPEEARISVAFNIGPLEPEED